MRPITGRRLILAKRPRSLQHLLLLSLKSMRKYLRVGWRGFLHYLVRDQTTNWSWAEHRLSTMLRRTVLYCLRDSSLTRRLPLSSRECIKNLLAAGQVSLVILKVSTEACPYKGHIHGRINRLKGRYTTKFVKEDFLFGMKPTRLKDVHPRKRMAGRQPVDLFKRSVQKMDLRFPLNIRF